MPQISSLAVVAPHMALESPLSLSFVDSFKVHVAESSSINRDHIHVEREAR